MFLKRLVRKRIVSEHYLYIFDRVLYEGSEELVIFELFYCFFKRIICLQSSNKCFLALFKTKHENFGEHFVEKKNQKLFVVF